MSVDELISALTERYPNVPETVEAVSVSLINHNNCILYGRGGHAKSGIIQDAITILKGEEFYHTQVFLHACSSESSSDHFIGYADAKTYRETGVKNYITDNIMYNFKIVVLEEGLDLPEDFPPGMRDPLTRKQYCNGFTCVPSRMESLFICTNVDPHLWAKTDSQKAFVDRFHYIVKSEWNNYEAESFDRMFASMGILDAQAKLVSTFAAFVNSTGFMSPRSAVRFYQAYKELGNSAYLKNFNGISSDLHAKFVEMEKMMPYLETLQKILTNLSEAENMERTMRTQSDCLQAIQKFNAANVLLTTIKDVPFTGEYTNQLELASERLSEISQRLTQKLTTLPNAPIL